MLCFFSFLLILSINELSLFPWLFKYYIRCYSILLHILGLNFISLLFNSILFPYAEIMLNLLFNTLLTITPHNTQTRRRRKESTTYGPLRRYSPLVTHPVLNPDRQGLTLVPLPNRVSRGLLRDTYF